MTRQLRMERGYASFVIESASTNTSPFSATNILWGAAATALLGATLADWQRKREEEARVRAMTRRERLAAEGAFEEDEKGEGNLRARRDAVKAHDAAVRARWAAQGSSQSTANAAMERKMAKIDAIDEAKWTASQAVVAQREKDKAAELAGLQAYYEGRKEGEEQAQSQVEKPWWGKAKDWFEDKVGMFAMHPPSWMSVSYQPTKPFSLGNSTIDEWVSYQPLAKNFLQSVVFQRVSVSVNESVKLTSNPAGHLDINFSNGRITLKGEEGTDGSRVDHFIQPFALSFGQTISTSTDRPDIRGVNVSIIDMDVLGKNWATIKVSQATGQVISPMPVTLPTEETIATSTTTLLKTEVSIHRWPRLLLAAGVLIFAWEAGGVAALGKLIPSIPVLERVFN